MSSSHLSITARREGWWRAGRQWSAEPTIVAVAEFTAEQIEMIRDDPHLIVTPAHPSDADGPAHASAAEAAEVPAADVVREIRDALMAHHELIEALTARVALLEDEPGDTPEIHRQAIDALERRLDALEGTAPPPASPSREERYARILEAVGQLDRASGGDWTASGAPTVAALERQTGLTDVTAAERDAAWAAVQSGG